MMNPQESLLANQYESGIPTMTLWDWYAMQANPIADAGRLITLDTQDANGGQGFTDFSPEPDYENPSRVINWYYEQNYQGTAPLELQPELELPEAWEMFKQ